MNRTKLLILLQNYFPEYPEEIAFKPQIIEFIKQNPQCFERSLEIGHITASAWLLNKDQSQALLMHHTKLNKWFQLGGHCDGDCDVLRVAVKEAQEESGINQIFPLIEQIFDIDIHLIPENKKEKAHFHYDIRFLLYITNDEQIIQNNESKELRWINKNLDTLPTQNPSVVRMFNKWITRKSYL